MNLEAEARPARPAQAAALALGLLGSLILHALGYFVLHWAGTMPRVDFDLQLPSEVQFGLFDGAAAAPPASASSEPSAATPAASAANEGPASPKKAHRPKRPEPRDGGVAADGGPAKAADAGVPMAGPTRPLLSAYAPAGAQIALRLHIGRIRESELADDVKLLLEAIPDWRLLVRGSGLDPLRDLERLYLASPDLQRANAVIAGQYAGGEDVPRSAVESLAAASGRKAAWRKRGGIAVAPWWNADDTERIVALIGPQQFAITRPDDLPRVLQIAQALARRKPSNPTASADELGDALLGLQEGQLLALTVEGARLFVRGNQAGVPNRLELSVQATAEHGLDVLAKGSFESQAAAEHARDYWEAMRTKFASHPLVAFIGLRGPLADGRLEADEAELAFRTTVSMAQARVVLGFVRGAFEPPASSIAPSDLPGPRLPALPPRAPASPPDQPAKQLSSPSP